MAATELTRNTLPAVRLSDLYGEDHSPYIQISRLESLPQGFREYHSNHRHDFYAIFYFLDGAGIHSIDFVDFDIGPGSVFLLRPGQVHTWNLEGNYSGFALKFMPDIFALHSGSDLAQFPFLRMGAAENLIQREQPDDLEPDFLRLERAKEDRREGGFLFSLLQIILFEIKEQIQGRADAISRNDTIRNLAELIESNWKVERSAAFYARQLCISPVTLNQLCKKYLGNNTKSIINERVVLEIKRMLVHTDLNILEIARETNFEDNAYFSRFFRNQVGLSPEKFRAEHRKVP